jgi:methyl-accepting chemotaxis protein
MNNFKVSTRLAILIGVLASILIAVGASGLFGMGHSNDSLKQVYENRVAALEKIGNINYLVQRNRVLVMDMLLQPQAENVKKRSKELQANVETVTNTWDSYLKNELSQEEQALADTFAKARKTYIQDSLLPAAAAMLANDATSALEVYVSKVSPLAPPVQGSVQKLVQYQLDQAKTEYETNLARYQTIRSFSIVAVALGLLLAIGLGVSVVRGLGRQLGGEPVEASELARAVVAGDLTSTVSLRSGDTSSMMAQLGAMQNSLASVVGKVRQGAQAVATSSAEIAQGNHDLSARTESQASALQQTAASMEQLSATVKQNADSAKQANQLAQKASSVAIQGGEVVSQVVETMKGINDSSKKIADIISVIDGIAFQTNILALNAAVEAARAGEQGRGFAVVATEVRSLAGRSADAAKEIKSLINASVERVEQGTLLVDQAGNTMTEVVGAIRRVTDIMGEINAASNEQATGVSQVGEAVQQIDQVTQQNAALVEEMAAAASSLQTQADDLVATVAVFKLAKSEAAFAHNAPSPLPHKQKLPIAKPGVPQKSMPRLQQPVKAATPLKKAASLTASSDADQWESF